MSESKHVMTSEELEAYYNQRLKEEGKKKPKKVWSVDSDELKGLFRIILLLLPTIPIIASYMAVISNSLILATISSIGYFIVFMSVFRQYKAKVDKLLG